MSHRRGCSRSLDSQIALFLTVQQQPRVSRPRVPLTNGPRELSRVCCFLISFLFSVICGALHTDVVISTRMTNFTYLRVYVTISAEASNSPSDMSYTLPIRRRERRLQTNSIAAREKAVRLVASRYCGGGGKKERVYTARELRSLHWPSTKCVCALYALSLRVLSLSLSFSRERQSLPPRLLRSSAAARHMSPSRFSRRTSDFQVCGGSFFRATDI